MGRLSNQHFVTNNAYEIHPTNMLSNSRLQTPTQDPNAILKCSKIA